MANKRKISGSCTLLLSEWLTQSPCAVNLVQEDTAVNDLPDVVGEVVGATSVVVAVSVGVVAVIVVVFSSIKHNKISLLVCWVSFPSEKHLRVLSSGHACAVHTNICKASNGKILLTDKPCHLKKFRSIGKGTW